MLKCNTLKFCLSLFHRIIIYIFNINSSSSNITSLWSISVGVVIGTLSRILYRYINEEYL